MEKAAGTWDLWFWGRKMYLKAILIRMRNVKSTLYKCLESLMGIDQHVYSF